MLVSCFLRMLITSTTQHSESSEVLHDISNGHLRSEDVALAMKTPPKEAEDLPSLGKCPGCLILSSKKPLGNQLGLVPTWLEVFQAGDKTHAGIMHYKPA